jgi:FtsH-binding integral membrane protein
MKTVRFSGGRARNTLEFCRAAPNITTKIAHSGAAQNQWRTFMAEFGSTIRSTAGVAAANIDAGLRAHMNKVYGTMSVGMLITFLAAWAIAGLAVTTDPSQAVAQISATISLTSLGAALYLSPLKWVVMFAPLAFVFGLSAAINKMSAATAQTVFYVFAAVMGLSISSIFLIFTGQSIIQIFLITSIAFAGLSITFAISAIGVLIFAGLTAYDTQNIKTTYLAHAHHGDTEWLGKSAIMGALSLYLNFINMFMMLLQLFGNRE